MLLVQEEGVLRGQELENALIDADYIRAIRIAFELRRPHKLLELFRELCRWSWLVHVSPVFLSDVSICLFHFWLS